VSTTASAASSSTAAAPAILLAAALLVPFLLARLAAPIARPPALAFISLLERPG
jgi:hypothetical protein